jgi:surfactin synthase thioesterase subunit
MTSPRQPIPLILIHHAGGSAAVFAPLIKALPPEIEACPVELPGRGRNWRLKPETTWDAAVDRLVEASARIEGECAILGHSVGAYLGLALATRWERIDAPARCTVLFASANAAPSAAVVPYQGSPLDTTDEEIFAIAAASGGGVDPAFVQNEQMRARVADLLRADFALGYEFLRTSRNTVTEADIVACYGEADIFPQRQLAPWRRHTTGEFDLQGFPGDHFYLQQESAALAKTIGQAVLDRA